MNNYENAIIILSATMHLRIELENSLDLNISFVAVQWWSSLM